MRRLALGFLATSFVVTLLLWPLHAALLDWDEVNYARGARLGFLAHYLERGTLSYAEFAEFVSAKRAKRIPELPDWFDEEHSPIYARREHPPLVSYMLSLVADSHDERVLRSVQLIGAVALAAAMLFAYATLRGGDAASSRASPLEPSIIGLAAVGLAAAWMGWFLFSEISMHGWTAVFVATSAAFTVRWLDGGRRKDGVLLALSLAFGAVALQTAAFVHITVVGCILALERGPKGSRFKHALALTGGVVLFFFALWPGSVLTSAFLHIPAIYAYAITRSQEYSMVAAKATTVWRSITPMLILTPAALGVLVQTSRDGEAARATLRRVAPCLAIGVLYTLALTRFALAPRYLLPGMAALAPVVGLAADRLALRTSPGARALGVVALALAFVPIWGVRPTAEHDAPLRQDLAWLSERLKHHPAYIQGGFIYANYLPGADYDIRTIKVDRQGLIVRERGYYRTLTGDDVAGTIVGVRQKRERYTGPIAAPFLSTCRRTDLATLQLFDCTKTATLTGARR